MQIVIEIPEHDKNVIERFVRGDGCEDFPPSIIENLIRAIYLGTPLPEGHGRLIDADETLKAMDSWDKFGYSCHDMFRLTKDSEKDYVSYVYYANMVKAVDDAPTILKADKGDKE